MKYIGSFQEEYCKGVDFQAFILADCSEFKLRSVYIKASTSESGPYNWVQTFLSYMDFTKIFKICTCSDFFGSFQKDYCRGVDIQAFILTYWSEFMHKVPVSQGLYLGAQTMAHTQFGPTLTLAISLLFGLRHISAKRILQPQ